MIYGNVPVIIPILASGYLLTVYLLLGLAQRHTENSQENGSPPKSLHKLGTRN